MKQFITKLAREAGKILMKHYDKHHQISLKTPRDLVTEADKEAERKIKSMIKKKFPTHSFLGEETGLDKRKSEYIWLVDPLDGTTNYSIKNPFFNTSIALAKGKEVIAAAIHNPYTKELFYAEKGKGAFLNGKRIHVSKTDKVSNSVLAYCHGSKLSYIRKANRILGTVKPKSRDTRRMGAAALELCYTAAGRTECYYANDSKPWDIAAGALIVREAGGKVTGFKNEEWNTSIKDIVATNGHIHKELIRLIKKGIKR